MKKDETTSAVGRVAAIRGSVVDIRFERELPSIYEMLRTGRNQEVWIEVLTQLDRQHVRGIALTPMEGICRGMAVRDTGSPLLASVGKAILSRMFDVFGNTIDRREPVADLAWRPVHHAPPPPFGQIDQFRGLQNGHKGHRPARTA